MFDSVWYYSLNHPPLTPPAVVFAPAWTILYILIFIALVMFVVKRSEKSKSKGGILFFGQLVLNFLWSPVFFGFHNILAAFIIILFLDIVVLWNILEFYKISKKSAYFLVPYFMWIIFATYINLGILLLN